MTNYQKSFRGILAFASSLLLVTASYASVIDLRNLPNNFEQTVFGQPNTVFYAQSVIADNVIMNEARARLHAITGTLNFNFMITGDRPDAGGGLGFSPDLSDIRYNSGQLNLLTSQPLTEFVINPNIAVTSGERLFLVFDALSYPASGSGNMWATAFNAAVDPYLPGEFVFFNTSGQTTYAQVNTQNWEHRSSNNEDLAILASFVAPEPGSLCLIGSALLMVHGFGLARIRRR